MIEHYDIEKLNHIVKYTVRGTYLFGDDKVVIEQDMYVNCAKLGSDILKSLAKDEPDFIYDGYCCTRGDMQIDKNDNWHIEIRAFDNYGKEIFHCHDIETLQQYLIAVEIVKVENLEE